MNRTHCLSLLLLLVTGAACAGRPAPPAEGEVAELIARDLPGARIQVLGVEAEAEAERVRVPATLDGSDVTLVLRIGEDAAWHVSEIEQAGVTLSLETIRRTAETMNRMKTLADALAAYRAAQSSYPMLDDQLGLQALVPEHYPADAPLADAWGEPFRYRYQDDDYTLTSSGPDRRPGTRDDVILVTGRFVGEG